MIDVHKAFQAETEFDTEVLTHKVQIEVFRPAKVALPHISCTVP